MRNLRTRLVGAIGASLVLCAALATVAAEPAGAGIVGQCAGPIWAGNNYYVCVRADTGAKNSSNHTQYVKSVEVDTKLAPSKLEAWIGNGPTGVAWYRSTPKAYAVKWTVNKWVKTNSGICGAYTYPGKTTRAIACITIKA